MRKMICVPLIAAVLTAGGICQNARPAYAAAETVLTGECGENLTWTLDTSTCTITISGTGKMTDYGGISQNTYTPWSKYDGAIHTVIVESGVTTIGNNAFFYCPNIYHVELPDSLESIGISAFQTCKSLAEIELPAHLKTIGKQAFMGCERLKTMEIPASVDTVDYLAFYNCASLEKVTILNPQCRLYPDSTFTNGEAAKKEPFYNGVICGYENSTAQTYAEKNAVKFESLGAAPTLTGDFDGDGELTAEDAQNVLTAYTEALTGGQSALTDTQKTACDIDGDGELTSADAQFILIYYTENNVTGNPVSWDDLRRK